MEYCNLHQMNLYDVFGDAPWAQEDFFQKDREYMKKMADSEAEKRTAYEVSVSKLEYIE